MKKINLVSILTITLFVQMAWAESEPFVTCSAKTTSRRIRDVSVNIKDETLTLRKDVGGTLSAEIFKKNGLSAFVKVKDGQIALILNDHYTERLISVVGNKLHTRKDFVADKTHEDEDSLLEAEISCSL